MNISLAINECRIPLESVNKLKAVKYPSKNLSSKHKRYIEHSLDDGFQKVAVFEGDILFCLLAQDISTDRQLVQIKGFLAEQIREFNENLLQPVTLFQLPTSTVERLIFALITAQAKDQGIYKLRGREFFQPNSSEKRGHNSVEITLVSEDEWIKVYFVPSIIVLNEIIKSRRTEIKETAAIGLCNFRQQCSLVNEKGKCKFFTPGFIGFVAQNEELSQLKSDTKEKLFDNFKDCPQIDTTQKVTFIKATKNAKNTRSFPAYAINLHFADGDFSSKQKLSFRNSTLMPSEKRLETTNRWVNKIFFNSNATSRSQSKAQLKIRGVEIPISIIIDEKHYKDSSTDSAYKFRFYSDQKIVVNQQNPQAFQYGGGYQFSQHGAYDRNDSKRLFEKVSPFLILPDDERIVNSTRNLMQFFADGYSPKENVYGDKEFTGINNLEGKKKYNVEFVNPWDEEEFFLLSDTSDQAYLEATEEIARQWALNEYDSNKMVIVIKPPETSAANSTSLYHDLKSNLDGAGIPNQFITFDTLAQLSSSRGAFGPILQSLWLNIYAKMGGIPWRIENEIGNVHCFIGIGFGINPSSIGEHIYAGVAHVFDKYGNWVDIASDSRNIHTSEYDSFYNRSKFLEGTASFKISQETTESIVYNALALYREKQSESGLLPYNIVLHKLGTIYECEVLGFLNAIKRIIGNLDECQFGILQIEQDHHRRLYGDYIKAKSKLNNVAFRGAGLEINNTKMLLTTTGRTVNKYFGIGTPNPLLLTSKIPSSQIQTDYSCNPQQFYNIETLGGHVMALTQLHWGSTKDNVRQPITTLYAHKVAELVSKMNTKIDTRASFHRPWFL